MSELLPTKLIEAGGCYDSQDFFLQCAMNPAECDLIDGSTKYRTSRYLSSNDPSRQAICSQQNQIRDTKAMGRCNTNSDKRICSSSASACQLSAGFSNLDPTCTLTQDLAGTSLWAESYFGKCLFRDDYEDEHCAWSSDDCAEGYYRFDWANPFFANSEPDCRCDDVKTGACVTSTDAADAGDFFCATSAEVCEEEDDSLGYYYIKPTTVESDLGVTCKLCDELPPPPEEKVVMAGYCATAGASNSMPFERCAMIPDDCNNGATNSKFVPASSVLDPSVVTPMEADACATPAGVREARVGRCDANSNNRMCASDQTACNLAASFKANDDQCSVAFDAKNNNYFGGFTYYSFCSYADDAYGRFVEDESVCVWRRQDCDSKLDANAPPMYFHDASPGISDSEPMCKCEMVRTGACVATFSEDNRKYICAVQEDACGDGYEYVAWRDLPPDLICHLCTSLPDRAPKPSVQVDSPSTADEEKVAADGALPAPGSPLPTNDENVGIALAPGPQTSPSSSEIPADNGEDGLPVWAIAAIIVGTAVALALLLVLFAVLRRRPTPKKDPPKVDDSDDNDEKPNATTRKGIMEPGQAEADLIPAEDHSVN